MESIKTSHTVAIAESQDEYNTVHGTFHETNVPGYKEPVGTVTIAFKFTPEELMKIVDNDGIFYYSQLIGAGSMRPIMISPENPLPEELR